MGVVGLYLDRNIYNTRLVNITLRIGYSTLQIIFRKSTRNSNSALLSTLVGLKMFNKVITVYFGKQITFLNSLISGYLPSGGTYSLKPALSKALTF
jgi:hypothetical protein